MQRILITGFFGLPAPDRAGVQMGHVLRALAPTHEVDVLVVRHQDQAYVERQGTARILRVPMPDEGFRARIEVFRRALRRQIEGADYDVVHVRDGWSGTLVIEMRKRLRHATVFDATRAPLAEPPSLELSLATELARNEAACLLSADHVLVPTETARNHMLQWRAHGVHLVPAGVDVDLFDWDDPPEGPTNVLFAGTVAPGRGVRLLLRAMADVVAHVDAKLLIAGRVVPSFAPVLRDAMAEHGLTGRVELLGEVPHEAMPAVIARAAVCVAPVAPELGRRPMALYPSKLLEYMACRRAVLAPRRGTAAMLLDSGTHGLLFQPGNASDLTRKLLQVLRDAELREHLAASGYSMVRQHHTASGTRRALRRAYAALMEERDSQEPTEPRAQIPAAPAGARFEVENTDQILPLFAQRTMRLDIRRRAATSEPHATDGPESAPAPQPAPEPGPQAEPAPQPVNEQDTSRIEVEPEVEPGLPDEDQAKLETEGAAEGNRTDEQPDLAPAAAQPHGHDEEIFWSRFETVDPPSDGALDAPKDDTE